MEVYQLIATNFLHCLFRKFRGTSKRDPLVDDFPFPSGHLFIDNLLVLGWIERRISIYLWYLISYSSFHDQVALR